MSIFALAQKLIVAAALAFAVLAPSVADAHPGHDHGAQVSAVKLAVAQKLRSYWKSIEKTSVRKAVQQELRAAYDPPDGLLDISACADRGCCSSGSCHIFSLVMQGVTVTLPPAAATQLRARDGPARNSLVIEGPRRPPKHFV